MSVLTRGLRSCTVLAHTRSCAFLPRQFNNKASNTTCLPSSSFTNPPVTSSSRLGTVRSRHDSPISDDAAGDTEFILSILQASPSVRDSRGYMASFAPSLPNSSTSTLHPTLTSNLSAIPSPTLPNPLVTSLLNPIVRRPALVKIQGPFTDTQLASISRGLSHLQKLGLVPVIVVDRDDIPPFESSDPLAAHAHRTMVLRDVERVVYYLTKARAPARPVLATVARLGDAVATASGTVTGDGDGIGVGVGAGMGEIYIEAEGLDHVRRAVSEGEIPVLTPVALDEGCKSRRISADPVIAKLAEAMAATHAEVGSGQSTPSRSTTSSKSSSLLPKATDTASDCSSPSSSSSSQLTSSSPDMNRNVDLTPHRLLIINREGGIPSYARSGLPHLSINLASELSYINRTFHPHWRTTHPTALSNLFLAESCLTHMPRGASALVVSHRSPAALIANLITNKPAHSASLPHALLTQAEGRITRDTPTLIRLGLPVKVLRTLEEVDKEKLTKLLERSFQRKLNQEKYFKRLEKNLDFVIVIGDYAGAALCTIEGQSTGQSICYLDKFAVLPSHQGDGTVDFLWVALRDETYGLGLLDAANPSIGSLSGVGRGRDLVWRSRSNNPVNKWYFERSNGSLKSLDGKWKMFWCDAEQRVGEIARDTGGLMRVIEPSEQGRLASWAPVIEAIPSAWED